MDKTQSALFSAVAYSYIYFIDDYLEVLKSPAYHSAAYLDPTIGKIIGEMNTLFLAMPSLLGGDSDTKETYAKKLVEFRHTLEEKYRTLHGIQRELQHITAYLNLKNASLSASYEDFNMTEEDALEMDFSRLAKDCGTFVFSTNDPIERQQKAASLLSFIPMRMTKESFMNYIQKAIGRISIPDTTEDAELLVSVLRQQFNGAHYAHYDAHFEDLRMSLEEIRTLEDPELFFDEAELTNETLDYTLSLVSNLYHMICVFSNLLIFDGLSFDSLTDMHVSFYDLYCSIQNITSNQEDKEILLETLPERVAAIKEELQEAFDTCRRKQVDNPLFELMGTYIDLSIQHMFGFVTQKHDAYSTEVTRVFRDFFDELQEDLQTLKPVERKLRMQYFMSVVPFIMQDNTFYSYVLQGFANTQSPIRNLYTAMYLSNILEQNDFFTNADDAAEKAHPVVDTWDGGDDAAADFIASHSHDSSTHHHHDEHCDCGHHH